LVPAIVGAGFDTTEFTFLGFFPAKKWRQTLIKKILASEYPTFFYESVHRIEKTLEDFKALGFVGQVSICREASKMFEQFVTWTLDEVLDMIVKKKLPIKGEFVVGIKNH
jgi:16S rRNA (cytidine1402-2'-O)-methyltransferase